jgi:hypothetical protein
MENRDFCSFFCEFLLPASSASSLRSAPGGIVAAPEQPFLAAQALSPCDAARTTGCGILSQPRWAGFLPLSRRSETKTDAPVVSRFLYRLTPTFVYCFSEERATAPFLLSDCFCRNNCGSPASDECFSPVLEQKTHQCQFFLFWHLKKSLRRVIL